MKEGLLGQAQLMIGSNPQPFKWESPDGAFLILVSATRQSLEDPERFVHSLMHEPEKALLMLKGDFLVAAGDGRRMVVAVDPLGIRAAYYARVNGHVRVADSSGAFARQGLLPAQANPLAVYHYLNLMSVPTPWSAYQGVHRLPSGMWLNIAKDGSGEEVGTLSRYWDIPFSSNGGSEESLGQELWKHIQRAVAETVTQASGQHQLGTFLSGGTDSSTIAGLAARQLGRSIPAYVAYYEDEKASELPYAEIAAKHFGLELRPILVTPNMFLEAVPWLVEAFDEPYGNASVVAAHVCTQAARRDGVTGMLAGDGGDEIFGGNVRYAKDKAFSWYAGIPRILRLPFETAVSVLPASVHVINRAQKAIMRANTPNPERFGQDEAFASVHWDRLLTVGLTGRLDRHASDLLLRDLWNQCSAPSDLDRLLYLDLKVTIADIDVRKIIGAATKDGVAVFFPFLDRALVEFALSVPAEMKVKGLTLRYLFKRAVGGFLPEVIIRKTKHGMGLPLGRWFREKGPVRDFMEEVLFSPSMETESYFRATCLRELWEEHQKGLWDHAEGLWRVVALELWRRVHLNGEKALSLIHH